MCAGNCVRTLYKHIHIINVAQSHILASGWLRNYAMWVVVTIVHDLCCIDEICAPIILPIRLFVCVACAHANKEHAK